MSRMAFLTRVFVFSHDAAAEAIYGRARAFRARVLLDAVEALHRDLELVARLVAEHHELAGGAADLQRLEAQEAPDAVLLVDDEVARLEVAEVGEEAPQAAAAAPRVEVDLLGEDVPVREDGEGGLGQLEPAGEDAHPGEDSRALADREAVLAQHVGESVRAAGVAEEHHGGRGRAPEVVGEAADVARVGGRGPAGEVEGRPVRVDLPHLDEGRRGEARLEGREGDERLRGLGGEALRPAGLVLDRARPEALRLLPHRLGFDHGDRAGGEVRPGRHGGAGYEGHEIGEPLGLEAALERLEEGGELAPSPEALGQHRRQHGEDGAGGEDVGERQGDEGLDGAGGPLGIGVEAAQALHGVAEELDAHRLLAVRGEDVEDAAAASHLAGRGDRVLPRVAALVERLEEDLGRHLVAHAQAHHARLEQVRGEARAEEARRRGDEGAGAPGLEERRRPPRRGVGMAGQAAEGGRSRRGQRQHGARETRLGGQCPQVLRRLLHVALAGHHHEEGRLGEEERDEASGGPHEAGERDAAGRGERRGGPRRPRGNRGAAPARWEPGRSRPADAVDDRGGRAAGHERHSHDPAPPPPRPRRGRRSRPRPSRRPSPARRAGGPGSPRSAWARRRARRGRPSPGRGGSRRARLRAGPGGPPP